MWCNQTVTFSSLPFFFFSIRVGQNPCVAKVFGLCLISYNFYLRLAEENITAPAYLSLLIRLRHVPKFSNLLLWVVFQISVLFDRSDAKKMKMGFRDDVGVVIREVIEPTLFCNFKLNYSTIFIFELLQFRYISSRTLFLFGLIKVGARKIFKI